MSDTQANAGGDQQQQPPVIINGQYVKDLSFESPNSPGIFQELQSQKPDINVNVNVHSAKLENEQNINLYEVTLDLSAEFKAGDKVGFVAELKYAGMFTLNIPEEHIEAYKMIECPRMLFPFARQILSDVTQQGGFMPLMLQPIDFAAMYRADMQGQMADIEKDVADTIKAKADEAEKDK